MRTPDYYTDLTMTISTNAKYCPNCGSPIKPQIETLLKNDPGALFAVCGACEVQLELIYPDQNEAG